MSGAAQETLVYEEVGQPEGLLRGAILNSADPVQGFGSGVNTLEYIAATLSSPSQLGAVDSETLLESQMIKIIPPKGPQNYDSP